MSVPLQPATIRAFLQIFSARRLVPKSLAYRALRAFHNGGRGVMVSTTSLEA